MTRRTFLPAAAGVSALHASFAQDTALEKSKVTRKGRLQQSVCRWCYNSTPLEELARESARLGLQSIDLIEPKDWPVAKKYGLKATMVPGGTTISDGFNRKGNHSTIMPKL